MNVGLGNRYLCMRAEIDACVQILLSRVADCDESIFNRRFRSFSPDLFRVFLSKTSLTVVILLGSAGILPIPECMHHNDKVLSAET